MALGRLQFPCWIFVADRSGANIFLRDHRAFSEPGLQLISATGRNRTFASRCRAGATC